MRDYKGCMYQDDFILRLIQQAAQSLAQALGRAGDEEEEGLAHAAVSLTGLSLNTATSIAPSVLLTILGEDERGTARAAALGMLLAERGLCTGASHDMQRGLFLMEQAQARLTMPHPDLDAAIARLRALHAACQPSDR